jgi:parallel beta-helix repeat protein
MNADPHSERSAAEPLPADRRALLAGIGGLAAGALLVGSKAAQAGPLNPPAGPVASTPGPEPRIAINAANTPGDNDATPSLFKITQPGSYYLTSNIALVNGRSAIEVTASAVTIDLNGFSISGIGGLFGIIVTNAAIDRLTIRNGSISTFLNGGIDANIPHLVLEHVNVKACGGLGIRAGSFARITHCSVNDCTSNATGINVGSHSIIEHCIASDNAGRGFNLNDACVVAHCTASFNSQEGIYAFGRGSTITHCTMNNNVTRGIWAFGAGCRIESCSATLNGTVGIGIAAADGGTVSNCTASENGIDGIVCNRNGTVRDNNCSLNGAAGEGAGIRALGSDNRIEGNNCSGCDRGIAIEAAGNIIVRNTCSGNTINWDIVANNIYGPIIDRRIPTPIPSTAAVSGSSAASTLGTTDANANFSY